MDVNQAVKSIDGAASTCMRQREHHHKEVRALTARCMREAAARERAAGEAATAREARHAKEVEELRAETRLQAEVRPNVHCL
jgi:ATP-dependent Clp protease ATP-binding subunit ClpA